jgi:two-component system LytT family sensor kinase
MKKTVIWVLHIGYWALYFLLIVSFLRTMQLATRPVFLFAIFLSPMGVFTLLPALVGFYVFYTVLFKRFLQRKRIAGLFLAGVLVAVAGGVGTFWILYFLWMPRFFANNDLGSAIGSMVFLSLLTLVHGVIGLVLRGFITSYDDIQLKQDLNKKNYEMELALIKSQINPHFLFNTINNIDVLIGMDAVKASGYLNKLSDIMRFMLYETKTEKIPLAKELTYIGKYIDLQKIRTANPNYVNYQVEGDTGKMMIEPMLFIPFIENAFKHAANKKKENAINIRFEIEEERISFYCENNYNEDVPDAEEGGLGNGLIRKRLLLLYPGRHHLEIFTENETYKAKLVLTTHAN